MVTRLAVDQSIDAPTTCEPYWSLLECQYVEDVDDVGLVHAGVHGLLGLIPAFSSSRNSLVRCTCSCGCHVRNRVTLGSRAHPIKIASASSSSGDRIASLGVNHSRGSMPNASKV